MNRAKLINVHPAQPHVVRFDTKGTEVLFAVGPHEFNFSYEDALVIADHIRFQALKAKNFARDTTRRTHVLIDLTDAETYLNANVNIREI